MSKYNNIKSISIESIPEEEMGIAIKEWAEGDKAMEKLLWACYKKGIKTSGCHAGGNPYIDFKYQNSIERLIPLFEVAQEELGSQILIMLDGGNPFSGPEWNLATIGIAKFTMYQDEADPFFDKLTDSLEKDSNNKEHPMLKLLEFLREKETSLVLRYRHMKEDSYAFYIESKKITNDRYQYYNDIFLNAGLIEEQKAEGIDSSRHGWKIEMDNFQNFITKLSNITEYIINEYSYEAPKTEDEIVDFLSLARYKKKNLSEEEFAEWLNNEKIRMEMEYEKVRKEELKKNELNKMINDNEEQSKKNIEVDKHEKRKE